MGDSGEVKCEEDSMSESDGNAARMNIDERVQDTTYPGNISVDSKGSKAEGYTHTLYWDVG